MNFERESFVNEYIDALLEKHEKALEETLKKALGFTEYGKTADLDLFDENNAALNVSFGLMEGYIKEQQDFLDIEEEEQMQEEFGQ